jgi:hypothetical protein
MGRHWGLDFDEDQIRQLIRFSPPRSKFFRLLRKELKLLGRWKDRPRGRAGDPLKQARQIGADEEF